VYADEGMYEEGLEELGWEHFLTVYEVCCTVKVTLREDKQEKRKRELNKFGTTLKPNMDQYPEKLGRLFERWGWWWWWWKTTYQQAVSKFGMDQVFQVMIAFLQIYLLCCAKVQQCGGCILPFVA
jgi:hypothetical protein